MEDIVSKLINPKLSKIIKVFLNEPDQLFHLRKISQKSKVPLTTTFTITKKLLDLGIITSITVGKMKLYKSSNNPKMAFLLKILKNE